ncbi:MAG: HDOD domain-containing protein [Fimbriimonadaceae bacterium]|nr:HDOD domain-containing protein [Fimbriimonadaceae bacterium]QYK55612.1 MAG: HDOD domain-containing protein [Fimbriimonadaceae bacterium]
MVDLPAMPSVIVQVLQATDKENVSMAEIEKLLSTDPSITTKLFKVVNSAYFGLPRQVASIGQALAILGIQQVRNLVLSIGVVNALTSPNPRIIEIQRQFWQHSFASATCAQTISRRKGHSTKEQELVFVGGLLHDIGRLFLLTLFNQPYTQVMTEASRLAEPLSSTEQRILGTTHAHLGGVLAEKWNFPVSLCEMITLHDGFEEGDPVENSERLYCVHIADRLASEIWLGEECSPLWPWDPRAEEWLGHSIEERKELRLETEQFVENAKELLGML